MKTDKVRPVMAEIRKPMNGKLYKDLDKFSDHVFYGFQKFVDDCYKYAQAFEKHWNDYHEQYQDGTYWIDGDDFFYLQDFFTFYHALKAVVDDGGILHDYAYECYKYMDSLKKIADDYNDLYSSDSEYTVV